MQSTIPYNATVAQDGSGNYTSINDAIAPAPENSKNRYYIHVKPGVYKEYVQVKKTNIALIGDAAATTIITGNKSTATGYKTFDTATVFVGGPGFIAVSLTIENSAPPPNIHQAVALNNTADRSAFYKCVFLGYQDTLYAKQDRQFYKECDIYGSVDFIFGSAKAVFQDCNIYARRVSLENVITAQSKETDPNIKDSGFSFQNCKITVAPEAVRHKSEVKVYLGRPWRNYATVVFMGSYLDDIVAPEGWMPMGNNTKMFYAEYNNRGPGANTSKRVKWPGYKVFKSATEAIPFTVSKLIDGDTWIPETGIPYKGGL